MSWRVLVRAENPAPGTLSTLEELTGLGRGEVLLALRRNGLLIGDGFDESRARVLAATLGGLGLSCSLNQAEPPDSEPSQFRVVLTGFKPGYRARLRETLQRLSGLPPEQIVVWLSRIPFVLKDSVDHETARKIKKALAECGGMVDLRAVSPAPAHTRGTVVRLPSVPAGAEPEFPAVTPATPTIPVSRKNTILQEQAPAAAVAEGAPEKPAVPPTPRLDQPPVLPEGRLRGEEPPKLCFQWPGKTPVDPPVIPSIEDRHRIPPSPMDSPPVIVAAPSVPGDGLSIYLHSVSPEAVDSVLGALCGRLDFKRDEAEALIGSGLPSCVASVHSFEKAAEIATLLERPGVTVGLSATAPSRGAARCPTEGFISWLNRNG